MMRFWETATLEQDMKASVAAFGKNADDSRLKEVFFETVTGLQGVPLRVGTDTFVADFQSEAVLDYLKTYKVFPDEDFAGCGFFDSVAQGKIQESLQSANDFIKQIDPTMHRLINSMLASTPVYDMPNSEIQGGSVSGCIGMVYLCPKDSWDTEFYAEMLVHEYVHNRLFLDDMVNGIFPDLELLKHPDAQVISSIRRTKRPYDKSFHAACVSATLSKFYDDMGKKEKADDFMRPLAKTVQELNEVDRQLAERGLNVITDHARTIQAQLSEFVERRTSTKA